MAKIYYDKDCDLTLLDGRVIGVIGFGSQGHAHAQNLKESGCQVIVGLAEGSKSRGRAQEAGLKVLTVAELAKEADIIMMLAPDTAQPAIYYESVEKGLAPGNTLMFAHGFNIHY